MTPPPSRSDAIANLFAAFRDAEDALDKGLRATEPIARLRALVEEAHAHPEWELQYLTRHRNQLIDGISRAELYRLRVPLERAAQGRTAAEALPEGDASTPAAPRMPLTLCAENVRSAFNVGSLFRTAHCFGLSGIWLAGYTPTPEHPQVPRSALGTELLLPWKHILEPTEAIAAARAKGWRVLALETGESARNVSTVDWTPPTLLLLGNERFGLSPTLLDLSDARVAIPLAGAKKSLNVAVAAGVACHTARQSWEASRGD